MSESLTDAVRMILTAAFAGADEQVSVDGHDHKVGHHHLRVNIVSPRFSGMSRLARHRLVQDIVQKYFADGSIHALILHLRSPDEH